MVGKFDALYILYEVVILVQNSEDIPTQIIMEKHFGFLNKTLDTFKTHSEPTVLYVHTHVK